MKNSIYKFILSAVIIFSAATILNSCTKADAINTISNPAGTTQTSANGQAVRPAANSILDQDLVITYAKDDNVDITGKFRDFTFHFTYTGSTSGPAAAWNNILTVDGTWSMLNSHDNITFAFPTNIISDLAFLDKQWIIGESTGTTIMLTAANGENDVIYFSSK